MHQVHSRLVGFAVCAKIKTEWMKEHDSLSVTFKVLSLVFVIRSLQLQVSCIDCKVS